MLAGKCESVQCLEFPVLATPKLDGIRCLIIGGKALSRTFKSIPNDHIRTRLEAEFACYRGEFDGELMIPNRNFNELSGDIRRADGAPNFRYHVFDHILPMTEQNVVDGTERPCPFGGGLMQSYKERMDFLQVLSVPDFCVKVLPQLCADMEALSAYEEEQIQFGYEGVMVRSVSSPYKCGRSSTKEGYLLKLKRFEDSEAEIIGFEEMMENQNVAERDAFGRTKRSTNAENLVPKGTLGKLTCKLASGVEFGLGTGFDQATRDALWAARDQLVGKFVKFKHQPSGADERPRFPVFLGFRDVWDM